MTPLDLARQNLAATKTLGKLRAALQLLESGGVNEGRGGRGHISEQLRASGFDLTVDDFGFPADTPPQKLANHTSASGLRSRITDLERQVAAFAEKMVQLLDQARGG